jgi:hypothetical protein
MKKTSKRGTQPENPFALADRLAQATLALLATHSLTALQAAALAKAAGVEPAVAMAFLAKPATVLQALAAYFTRRTLAGYQPARRGMRCLSC